MDELEELKRELAERGSDAVIERLRAHPDPRQAPILFSKLAQHAHHERRELQAGIALAQAGMAYAQARADAEPAGSEGREYYLQRVKAMSFNLAANTWPGWGDGVEISAAELTIGMEAATRHGEVVEALALGPDKQSVSQWIRGAHELAAGHLDAARERFERSRDLADEAGSAPSVELAKGYVALVDVLQGREGARARLDAVIAHFDAQQDADSRIYGGQLRTALAAFE